MKIDLFSIGKLVIHSYGLMIGIGIICCAILGMYRAKRRNMSQEAVLDIVIISVISGFLGAKLLYVIVEFQSFLEDPLRLLGSEGFVVYGGIIAGALGAMLYCRRKKLVFLEYFDLVMPSVAVAQGFGRIGCFMAGCCYGSPTSSSLGVMFPEGSLAPAGVKLLPTQLFSSAGDFLIAIILILYAKKAKHTGDVGALYLLLYGVGRFFIEFLRSDERGAVGPLSTSQAISIVIVVAAVVLFWRNRKMAAKASDEEVDKE
jgi:phosphatidylglycerol:prolipoprotein diacylglycerol transferase